MSIIKTEVWKKTYDQQQKYRTYVEYTPEQMLDTPSIYTKVDGKQRYTCL